MTTILGFIFIIIIIVLIFGLSIIGGILRLLFGTGRRQSRQQQQTYTNTTTSDDSAYTSRKGTSHASRHSKKKIFDKDEGEYVEFEEITDDKNKK